MTPQGPLGPFCQSCSMPLDQPEDFATASSGPAPQVVSGTATPQDFRPGDEQC